MKKLALILALVTGLNANSQIAVDKALHFNASSLITSSVNLYVYNDTKSLGSAFVFGALAGFGSGIAKEGFDYFTGGHVSIGDFGASALGTITSSFVMIGIQELQQSRKRQINYDL